MSFEPGDRVVYMKPKRSVKPGPRAKDIHPSSAGEDYNYIVDKYWVVTRIVEDNKIEVKTRRGKVHQLQANDPLLRAAYPWEKWFKRSRFPEPDFTSSS